MAADGNASTNSLTAPFIVNKYHSLLCVCVLKCVRERAEPPQSSVWIWSFTHQCLHSLLCRLFPHSVVVGWHWLTFLKTGLCLNYIEPILMDGGICVQLLQYYVNRRSRAHLLMKKALKSNRLMIGVTKVGADVAAVAPSLSLLFNDDPFWQFLTSVCCCCCVLFCTAAFGGAGTCCYSVTCCQLAALFDAKLLFYVCLL